MKTSAILFDFGGTLDSDGVAWKERFYRLWRAEGEDVSRERFDRAYYDADDAIVGGVPETFSFQEMVEQLARGVAGQLGTSDTDLPGRVAARFCMDARENLRRSGELFARLKPRYKLGIVSNFYGNLEAVCRELGFDGTLSAAVDSVRVGCSKPDPAIFREALARLGAEAAEVVFVGDSVERDMAGARGVGMRHVLLAERGGPPRGGCCPGDAVIGRLAEIEALL